MEVILAHVNADFDCLGGLAGARVLYPGAVPVLPAGESPAVRAFLALHRELLDPRPPQAVDPETLTRIVVVDTVSRHRLGACAEWLELPGVEVHLYDHHTREAGDIPAAFRRLEPWGAASSVVAHTLRERGLIPAPFEASALLLGIYEDTGSLRYAGTAAEDLEAAAWLLRCGGDLEVVARFLQPRLSPEQRRLLHRLLDGMERHDASGLPVAVAVAPPGPYVEETAALAHRILEAEDAGAVFLIAPMEDAVYLIARSRTDALDVGAVLRDLGGGGHPRAASALLRGTGSGEVRTRLLAALEGHGRPEPAAREIMSAPVRTIGPEATIGEARRRMQRYGHSGLVVLDRGRLVGVITRRDVDKARHHSLDHAPVRGFMARDVVTISLDAPLSVIEERMLARGVGRLPVLRNGEVVGIVTRTDLLRALHGARYLAGSGGSRADTLPQLLRERLPARVQRLLGAVGRAAEEEHARVYCVGGFVRDLLLGVQNLDLDLLVEPDGIALARRFAERCRGTLAEAEPRFGTARVMEPGGLALDFATARTEWYAHPGALPEVEASSVSDDLRRRDFTVNAMAVAVDPEHFGELLDPFGGRADLEDRRLRVLHPLSFVEDPTRLFRAVRFEERFHFRLDPQSESLARQAITSGALERISPERLRRELWQTFGEPRPVGALLRLHELGVWSSLVPGFRLDESLLQSVPGALEWWRRAAGDPIDPGLLFLAALLAGLPPHTAAAAAERLRLTPPHAGALSSALEAWGSGDRLLDRAAAPSETVRRLRRLPAEALALLAAGARRRGAEGRAAREVLELFVRTWRHVKLEFSGDDLRAAGFPAGPPLGAALRAALEARLDGRIAGRDEELAFAVSWLRSRGDSEEEATCSNSPTPPSS